MDKAREQYIKTERSARYFIYGEITESTKNIIIAFHGYGQLGSFFAPKFSFLANKETVVVIPEALSRFYLDSKYDRVGASWMTKLNKEFEISDMLAYLNTLWLSLNAPVNAKLHLFGFSQGCATALRWANQLEKKASSLVLWAGYFAKGVEDLIDQDKIEGVLKTYVYGNRDEFLISAPELAKKMKAELEKLNFKIIEFNGPHKTPIEELKKVYASIVT